MYVWETECVVYVLRSPVFEVNSTLSSQAWGSLAWSNSTLHVDLSLQCSDLDREKCLLKYKRVCLSEKKWESGLSVQIMCVNNLKMSVSLCVHKNLNKSFFFLWVCIQVSRDTWRVVVAAGEASLHIYKTESYQASLSKCQKDLLPHMANFTLELETHIHKYTYI